MADAPKKPERRQPPDGGPKRIKFLLWSAFTRAGVLDDDNKEPKPHWLSGPAEVNVVRRALVSLPSDRSVKQKTTDANGVATLDLTGMRDATYDFLVEPDREQFSSGPAGPLLKPTLPRGSKPPPGGLAWPERMYRPFTVRVVWSQGKIAAPPPILDDPDYARIIRHGPNGIEIDWKLDFLKARYIDARAGDGEIRAVVLHRTYAPTIGSTLGDFIKEKDSDRVNAHYVIDTDGFVVKMVPDELRAAHAGTGAQWYGKSPVNDFSIGIENVLDADEKDKDPRKLTEAQMIALIALLRSLMDEYPIPKVNVLGHNEVSPLLKNPGGLVSNERDDCPGKTFDWPRLEKLGLAARPFTPTSPFGSIAVEPYFTHTDNKALREKDNDKDPRYGGKEGDKVHQWGGLVRRMQRELANLGYERAVEPGAEEGQPDNRGRTPIVPVLGKYDRAMGRVVQRFQRRYMQDTRDLRVGAEDTETDEKKHVEERLGALTALMMSRVRAGRRS